MGCSVEALCLRTGVLFLAYLACGPKTPHNAMSSLFHAVLRPSFSLKVFCPMYPSLHFITVY